MKRVARTSRIFFKFTLTAARPPADARRHLVDRLSLHSSYFSLRDLGEGGLSLVPRTAGFLPPSYRIAFQATAEGSTVRICRFLAWPHRLFFGAAYGVLGVWSVLAGLAIACGKLSPSDVRASLGGGLLLWIGFLGMHAYYAFSDRQQDDWVHRIITQAFEGE